MTILAGKLIDVTGKVFAEPDAFLVISSTITRPGREVGSVVLRELHRISLSGTSGAFTTPDLEPGPIRVKLEGGTIYGEHWDVVIPDSDTVQLVDLIGQQVDWAPEVVGRAEQAARQAEKHLKDIRDVAVPVKDAADKAQNLVAQALSAGAAMVRVEVHENADRAVAAQKAAEAAKEEAISAKDLTEFLQQAANDAKTKAESSAQTAETAASEANDAQQAAEALSLQAEAHAVTAANKSSEANEHAVKAGAAKDAAARSATEANGFASAADGSAVRAETAARQAETVVGGDYAASNHVHTLADITDAATLATKAELQTAVSQRELLKKLDGKFPLLENGSITVSRVIEKATSRPLPTETAMRAADTETLTAAKAYADERLPAYRSVTVSNMAATRYGKVVTLRFENAGVSARFQLPSSDFYPSRTTTLVAGSININAVLVTISTSGSVTFSGDGYGTFSGGCTYVI